MEREPRVGVVVSSSTSRARCSELWAVLDAAGIAAWIEDRRGMALLVVREHDLPRALRELDDYGREGARVPELPELVALRGGGLGAAAYVLTLVTVAGLVARRAFGIDWFAAGRVHAGSILAGEWWRAVTALTLHVDSRHLLGNALFGSLLGFLAAQGLGGGVAWLAILTGGAAGNVANALLREAGHTAVGASTAVFATLGVLVSLSLYHKRRRPGGTVRRWSPLFAGIVLLVWTGTGGERTDVQAHVTGLLAGLLVGLVAGLIPLSVLERRTVQIVAGFAAAAVVALAWLVAA